MVQETSLSKDAYVFGYIMYKSTVSPLQKFQLYNYHYKTKLGAPFIHVSGVSYWDFFNTIIACNQF